MKKFFNLLSALLILALSTILITGCSASNEKFPPMKTATIHADKTALEISTPFELKDYAVPENLNGAEVHIKRLVIKNAENNECDILACGYVFDKETIEAQTGQPFTPNLEGALLGAVGNIKTVHTSSDVKDVTINGMHGKEITGTLDLKFDGDSENSRCEFCAQAFGLDGEMWTVMIIRKPGDETKRISDAVFNSLKVSRR